MVDDGSRIDLKSIKKNEESKSIEIEIENFKLKLKSYGYGRTDDGDGSWDSERPMKEEWNFQKLF